MPLPNTPSKRSRSASARLTRENSDRRFAGSRSLAFRLRATDTRNTATVATRNPVDATGLNMPVAYFTTTKLIPQIAAIMNSSTSVTPNFGCDVVSEIAIGGPIDSVIAEN
jgi:hypothetical protein